MAGKHKTPDRPTPAPRARRPAQPPGLARRLRAAEERARQNEMERLKATEELRTFREESFQQHEQIIEAQQALEESRDRFASLFDYAPVALLSLGRNGVIHDINLRGADLLGTERQRIMGLPLLAFVVREDHKAFLHHMLQCRRRHHAVNTELRLKMRPGRQVPVLLSTWTAASQFRAGYEFRTAITDLSERERATRREADYQRRLRSLASELSLAEERERRRIAVEIHDHISQSLATAKMKLDAAGHKPGHSGVRPLLQEASALVEEVLARTRSLTFELSPPRALRAGAGRGAGMGGRARGPPLRPRRLRRGARAVRRRAPRRRGAALPSGPGVASQRR